jgi:hypothetical protein
VAVDMQLPDDLAARLARVVSDVEATAGVDLSFRDEPYSHRGPSCMVWDESGSGTGIAFRDVPGEHEIAWLADQIQEVVIETRWHTGHKPVEWPECPARHTHPLEATSDSGEAMWTCPKDATIRFTVGSLG